MLLLAAAAALLIAACGGSSSASTTKSAASSTAAATSTAGAGRFAALRACLSKHGITIPARRPGAGHGFFGTGTAPTGTAPTGTAPTGTAPTGTAPGRGFFGATANPKLAAALKACGASFPAGGFRGGAGGFHRPTFTRATLERFVACVRRNGYPQMPEPSASPKATGGLFPSSIQSSAKFKAASVKCIDILRPSAPAGTPTQTTRTPTQTTGTPAAAVGAGTGSGLIA